MINWEKCELETGVTAEFPMDLLPIESLIRMFCWDQDKGQVVPADSNKSFISVPTYAIVNENIKEEFELSVDKDFDYQGVEIISGNTKGFLVFQKLAR